MHGILDLQDHRSTATMVLTADLQGRTSDHPTNSALAFFETPNKYTVCNL